MRKRGKRAGGDACTPRDERGRAGGGAVVKHCGRCVRITRRTHDDETRLAAMHEFGEKLQVIKRQLVQEKAEALVAIGQRDRLIAHLRQQQGQQPLD